MRKRILTSCVASALIWASAISSGIAGGELVNGNMTDGEATPSGWTKITNDKGEA